MKLIKIVCILLFCFILTGCQKEVKQEVVQMETYSSNEFYIKANNHTFTAKFSDNSSAAALKELLKSGDLSIDMHDYGSFEKVGDIGTTLPQNNTQITTKPGDVILYQGTSLTIYYDMNSWNFTKVGEIQNISKEELLDVLGKGNVTVTFSLKE